MNRRGINRFVEIEKMLEKEEDDDLDMELMDYRDDLSYL